MSVRHPYSPTSSTPGFIPCTPIPQQLLDPIPQRVPDLIAQRMPDSVPQRIPDSVPQRLLDPIPQRVPDSLPMTKTGSRNETKLSSPSSNSYADFSKYLSAVSPVNPLPRGSPLQSPSSAFSCYGSPMGYLSRLQSHPMFHDLQVLLSQECQHLQVPASLITTHWNASFPSTTTPVGNTAHEVIRHHIDLQDSFLRLHANPACRASSLQLENLYCCEVGRIEMGRYQALCSGQGRQSVNIFYDEERVRLACRTRDKMEQISPLSARSVTSVAGGRLAMGMDLSESRGGPVSDQAHLSAAATSSSSAAAVASFTSSSSLATSTTTAPVQLTSAKSSSSLATSSTAPVQLTSSTTAAAASASSTSSPFPPGAPVQLISTSTSGPVLESPSISDFASGDQFVVTHTKIPSSLSITSSSSISSFSSHLSGHAAAVSSSVITSTSSPSANKNSSRMSFKIEDFLDVSGSSSSPDAERESVEADDSESQGSAEDTSPVQNTSTSSTDVKISCNGISSMSNTSASSDGMSTLCNDISPTSSAFSIDRETSHDGISPVLNTSSSSVGMKIPCNNISPTISTFSIAMKTPSDNISPVLNTSASNIVMKTSCNDTSPVSDFLSPGDDSRGLMMFTPPMMLTPHEQTRQQRLNTTRVLTDWYDTHVRYPYPSDHDVSVLCDLTDIKPSQVRKWLANKRVRSFNTLSITGNDHPIKYKYQNKEGAGVTMMQAPTRRPQYKVLNNDAKRILADWFDDHVLNPYPTEEEKEELSRRAEISVSQVKSWFANKRSRTNNTRRQIPNYFIKKYPNCTPMVQMVVDQRQQRKQASQFDKIRVSLFSS
ncbi:serine-rich adhesin for platelets-like [Gigantopelta aegis]|uniref:serine-rich adhesin for platelets-like n=1 Tax=Gigantopelta aegis TaxID=1735272 RepID=UPI001B88831D|nr:serine-rich adhesin for platelets-like [Gigantopelta aegis]